MHWLGVQDREFPGTISGTVEMNAIGPATPFEWRAFRDPTRSSARSMCSASVTFSCAARRRRTDHALAFARRPDAAAVRRSARHVERARLHAGRHPPQPGVRASSGGGDVRAGRGRRHDRLVRVGPVLAVLPAGRRATGPDAPRAEGRRVAGRRRDACGERDRGVTSSLRSLPADAIEGIVTFPAQATPTGSPCG